MSDDLYRQMAALGRERDEVAEQEAKLRARRELIEERMRALASRLLEPPPAQATLFEPEPQPEPLAPRYLRLLRLTRDHPFGAEVVEVAKTIYGDTKKASRINISSDFSRLRSMGHVEPVTRGVFKITEQGQRALNFSAHQAGS